MTQGAPCASRVTRRAVLVAGASAVSVAAAIPLFGCDASRRDVGDIVGGFVGTAHERGHVLRDASRSAGLLAAPPAVTRRTQVLIAGAGVAGLAAARALRAAGQEDFALLELEDAPGGNSRGAIVGGLACPMGAHYLPVPGDDAHEVQDLLEELGLRRRIAGRWTYDERHLCHSPQERLYIDGGWQEGLLPVHGASAESTAQYRRFSQAVDAAQRESRYAMPAFRSPLTARQQQLSAQRFGDWLGQNGFDDVHLRWYLDYCCRDDYGAGADTVSAWAGLHYFASRHGFAAPGDRASSDEHAGDNASEDSGVLTWPEGNGWLTQRMAAPLGDRYRAARTVMRIAPTRHGVEVDAFDHSSGRMERWLADRCIVALPLHVAARVVAPVPAFLAKAAASTPHAVWLVANIHIDAPLADRPGAAPAWDNVLYGSSGLGYVDARHQTLDPRPGPTVLTWYRALGASADARRDLLSRPWNAWRDEIVAELSVPHPDLAARATRMDITRYGHAMAVPVPRVDAAHAPAVPRDGRLLFAHSDWAGYSVFEEAFTRGHLAGVAALR